MSREAMYSRLSSENGNSAYGALIQASSNEQTFSVSGTDSPWSIGINLRFLQFEWQFKSSKLPYSSTFCYTRILHKLRSKLSIRKSRMPILWNSSFVNRSNE
jgi:hypothetical protein